MKYEFTIDDLNRFDFCNKDDEKIVKKYLKDGKKVEYSENKNNNLYKVFIYINGVAQHIADIKIKL